MSFPLNIALFWKLRLTFITILVHFKSCDGSVGIATRTIEFRFPVGTGNFSLNHRVETGSVDHPASYPMGTGALSFSGVKSVAV